MAANEIVTKGYGVERRRLLVTPEAARVQLHLSIAKMMPTTELFKALDELVAQEQESWGRGLRERAVKFMLEKVIQSWEQVELSEREGVPGDMFEGDSFFEFLEGGEISLDLYSTFKALRVMLFPTEFFNSEATWLRLVTRLIPSSLADTFATKRGWNSDKTDRFVAKLACHLYKLFLSTHQLTEIKGTTILLFLKKLSIQLTQHMNDEARFAGKMLADEAQKASPPTQHLKEHPSLYGLQTDLDKAVIAKIEKTSKRSRLEGMLGVVRRATDRIRSEMPALQQKGMATRALFWKIHSEHFGEDPFLSQSLSDTNSTIFEYITEYGSQGFYSQSVGKTRGINVSSGDTMGRFSHLPEEFLELVEIDFFNALDTLPSKLDKDEVRNLLVLCDYMLEILHLPFDGSGRTIEDFLVVFAKKFDYDATISTSGYRAVSSRLMMEREFATRSLKTETRKKCLIRLGVDARGVMFDTERSIVEGISKQLKISIHDAMQAYFSEMALFCNEIVQMIRNHDFSDKVFSDKLTNAHVLKQVWKKAEKQRYIFTPHDLSKIMDTIFALISELGRNRYAVISVIANAAKILRFLKRDEDIVKLAKESYYRLCGRDNAKKADEYYQQLFPN